jgi:hemoglobin
MIKKELSERKDIELLVNTFYDKVRKDPVIGHIFNHIIGDDWSHHLPVMYQFWETVILNKPGYVGNPVGKHIEVDRKIPLNESHYQRWLELWKDTVDSLFEGEKAEEIKKRAVLMMQLIDFKVTAARKGNSLF